MYRQAVAALYLILVFACWPGRCQLRVIVMKLGAAIQKILNKNYAPLALTEARFKNIDLAFKTDPEGRPVLLFMGKKAANGSIKGDRFTRTLKIGVDGTVIKDHWEHKGKAT